MIPGMPLIAVIASYAETLLYSYALPITGKAACNCSSDHHLEIEFILSTDLQRSFQDDGDVLQAPHGSVQLVNEIRAQHASGGHAAHMPAVCTCQDPAHLSEAAHGLLAGLPQEGLHLLLYIDTQTAS